MTNRLLIIDSETSGLDSHLNSLLSLGAVVWEDGRILAEKELMVAEDAITTDPESMRINKINLSRHVNYGLPPYEAVQELESFLSGYFDLSKKIALAGHNIGFDVGFLKRLYRLGGTDYESRFSHRLLDTASIMRFLNLAGRLSIGNPSLDAGLLYFNVVIKSRDRHSALGDARATAILLAKLVDLVHQAAP